MAVFFYRHARHALFAIPRQICRLRSPWMKGDQMGERGGGDKDFFTAIIHVDSHVAAAWARRRLAAWVRLKWIMAADIFQRHPLDSCLRGLLHTAYRPLYRNAAILTLRGFRDGRHRGVLKGRTCRLLVLCACLSCL